VCRRLRQRLAAWKQHAAGRLSDGRAALARAEAEGTARRVDGRPPAGSAQ
jgi:hypothetical protein